jgi:hypothetical protein
MARYSSIVTLRAPPMASCARGYHRRPRLRRRLTRGARARTYPGAMNLEVGLNTHPAHARPLKRRATLAKTRRREPHPAGVATTASHRDAWPWLPAGSPLIIPQILVGRGASTPSDTSHASPHPRCRAPRPRGSEGRAVLAASAGVVSPGFVACPCAARACAAVSRALHTVETIRRRAPDAHVGALAAQGQPRASTINVHAHSMHSPALAPAGAGRAAAGVGARVRCVARYACAAPDENLGHNEGSPAGQHCADRKQQ